MAEVRCLNDAHGEGWAMYHGDCVSVVEQLPPNSIDMAVYSPPFSGLYIYNDSVADMGNCADDGEFIDQYRFLCRELYKAMKPGRIVAVHCKDLVYYRNQRGTAGLRDFPGMLIRAHEEAGFDFHSRVTIWRCPVREMTKTKARGLLYKQLCKDSSMSRTGMPDYVLVFRKPGKNEHPVSNARQHIPLDTWQKWASPVWMDIDQTNVLNGRQARDERDERHICPLQLDLIERALMMWSNPGDVVLSPFMGIGSEGVVSLRLGRKFVGVELKEQYWRQACGNLSAVEAEDADLFGRGVA